MNLSIKSYSTWQYDRAWLALNIVFWPIFYIYDSCRFGLDVCTLSGPQYCAVISVSYGVIVSIVSVYLLQKLRTDARYFGWFLLFFIFATVFRVILFNITRPYAFSYLDFGSQTEFYRNFARNERINSLELVITQLRSLRIFWGVSLWLPVTFKLIYDGILSIQKFKNVEKQNLDFEIGVLKSQINPQFINGALENIKKMAVFQPEQAAQMVLKLSNATRYTLYETDADRVPLQKELDFIINCIDLEETRLANRANINFRLKTNQSEQLQIAPMLLFPLIERAFKCIKSSCDIDLLVENAVLTLKIEADKLTNCQNEDIESIKKRLAALYPNKYRLQVVENEGSFKVDLKIEL